MGFTSQSQCVSLAILFILGAMTAQVMSRDLEDVLMYEKYEEWISRYEKIYKDKTEKETRFQIFKENVKHIELTNSLPNKSYKLGLNQFADLTHEEFTAFNNGFKSRVSSMANNVRSSFRYENVSDIPSTIDWRLEGAVTPVKNQGGCGCCWAFSAVAAMEGAVKLATGELISLSAQELVDCDSKGMNKDCVGGYSSEAFKFIIKNKGLNSEANYPYMGVKRTCIEENRSQIAASIKGFELVPPKSEEALLKAVAHQPVSVAVGSNSTDFKFYASGIFTGECDTKLDHEVTIIGYGVDSDGTKYWLAKNSWSTQWGEEGYMRIQRDVDAKEGLCGLAIEPTYPIA